MTAITSQVGGSSGHVVGQLSLVSRLGGVKPFRPEVAAGESGDTVARNNLRPVTSHPFATRVTAEVELENSENPLEGCTQYS